MKWNLILPLLVLSIFRTAVLENTTETPGTTDETPTEMPASNDTTEMPASNYTTVMPTTGAPEMPASNYTTVMPTTGGAPVTAVSLKCHELYMSAMVDEKVLLGKLSNLTVENCGNYTVEGNKVSTNFSECANNITQGNDMIILENTISFRISRQDKTKTIERVIMYYFKLQCKFNRRLNITHAVAISVDSKKETFQKASLTNFTAAMTFFDSNMFKTEANSPLQVAAFQPIFIQIKGVHNNKLFKFITEDCFATPSGNPWDMSRYLFFSDKCPIDTTHKEYMPDTVNKFSFSVDAFSFIMLKKTVYFHCSLLVCKVESDSDECTQNCTDMKRKRRAIEEGGLERITVNSGAIQYKRKPTCRDVLSTCPTNAYCINFLFPAVCRCNEGFVLDVNANQCSDVNLLTIRNLHLDMDFNPFYADTASHVFIRLATYVEKKLMTTYSLDEAIIKGVKVIRAREGSVVLDLQVKYAKKVTPREAFDSFINSVIKSERDEETLEIKRHILPFLDGQHVEEEITREIIIIAVVVPIILIMFVTIIVLVIRNKRNGRINGKPTTSFVNEAVSVDNLS